MPKFIIDEVEYDTESLSQDDMNHFIAFQFTENEIKALQMRLAAMRTAKIGYAKELKARLEKNENNEGEVELPENLSFD